ncbi:MAG: hypothetical protein PHX52_00330 [Candidatus Pacebacteria bacterium]|nr:hypothetical protein [Candidatus Paceibacterota bacterium]
MKKNFNIGENIGFGFDRTLKNVWFFVGFFIVLFISSAFFSMLDDYKLSGIIGFISEFIISISGFLFSFILFLFLLKISLNLIENVKINFKEINESLNVFLKFVLTVLTYWLIVFVGLIFFIVPGVILMIKYQFAALIVLDEKDVGIREAFRKSNVLASGVQWKLFWFSIISDFVNFAGLIFFFVGFLITAPTTIIAKTRIYRELKKQSQKSKKTVFLQD